MSGIPPYKIATYNVDQAKREEAFEETRWMNRYERVIKLIQLIDADILCLQEMRNLPGCLSVHQFLAQLCDLMGYDYRLQWRNPTPSSFGQAILWKRQKLFCLDSDEEWLPGLDSRPADLTGHKESLLFGVSLMPIDAAGNLLQGREPISVYNAHFPVGEKDKELCARAAVRYLTHDNNLLASKVNTVVCGDFNFFEDMEGVLHRAIFTKFFDDAGQGAQTRSGFKPRGTFVGYEHDSFHADLPHLTRPLAHINVGESVASRLDHIFLLRTHNREIVLIDPMIYPETMLDQEPDELSTRQTPSDHLPISVMLRFEDQN